MDIKDVLVGHSDIGQITARGVENALGRARGTGGVENKERVLGVHGLGSAVLLDRAHLFVPVHVTPGLHRHHVGRTANDDDGIDAGAGLYGLIRRDLERDGLSRAQRDIACDHHLGIAVLNTAGQRGCTESAKYDRMDRTDARAGQNGNRQFGDHRHIDSHAIAAPDAVLFEDVGELVHLAVHILVGEDHHILFGLALPDDGWLVLARGRDMSVQAVV